MWKVFKALKIKQKNKIAIYLAAKLKFHRLTKTDQNMKQKFMLSILGLPDYRFCVTLLKCSN